MTGPATELASCRISAEEQLQSCLQQTQTAEPCVQGLGSGGADVEGGLHGYEPPLSEPSPELASAEGAAMSKQGELCSGQIAIDCNFQSLQDDGAQAKELGADSDGSATQSAGCTGGHSLKKGRPINREKAEGHVQRMLARIRDANLAGERKKADYLTKQYLQSLDAKDIMVLQAWRKLKPHRRPNVKKLPVIAERLNAWEGTDEPVILSFKEKTNKPGYHRPILDFGIENRALQYLVLGALRARADLHPSQYALKGSHAAIKRVAELMANGYKYAVEIDIKDCFASFDGEKVVDLLPLPRRVTMSVLLNGSHNLVYHSTCASFFGQAKPEANQTMFAAEHAGAQRGFPQGSAASPLAVEMLLASLYVQLPATGVSVGYADNFLALGTEEKEAVAISSAFGCALKAHPAGHLVPNLPKSFGPGQPVEFLGHRLQRCQGAVKIDPTAENVQKFWDRVSLDVIRIKASPDKETARWRAAEARGYVRSWTSMFVLCNDINNYKAKALERIALALG